MWFKYINPYKTVEYFGQTLTVPSFVTYIATDMSGEVNGFAGKPEAHEVYKYTGEACHCWIDGDGNEMYQIGYVEFEGYNWMDTLVEI